MDSAFFTPKRVVVYSVGLEKYHRRPNGQIPDVRYAVADATAFVGAARDLWSPHCEFEQDIIGDAEASLTRIEDDLRWKIRNLDADDLFIFYYAGHGFHGAGGNRLTAADTNVAHLEGTTLLVRELLTDPLEASSCNHSLLFIDACASDLKEGFGTRDVVTSMDADEYKAFLHASEYSAVFLSCKPKEKSFSCHQLKHGVWTWHLVQALLGKADDAIDAQRWVTDASLKTYLTASVGTYVRDTMAMTSKQTPQARITATGSFPIRHVPAPVAPPPPEDLSGFLLTPLSTTLTCEETGQIRQLRGFKPTKHHLPATHSIATGNFVAGLLDEAVRQDGEHFLTAVQRELGLRLADLEIITDTGSYEINAEHFVFSIVGGQDSENADRWQIEMRLALLDGWKALGDKLDKAFGSAFSGLDVSIEPPTDTIAELADQMEDLKSAFGGTVTVKGKVARFQSKTFGFEINLPKRSTRLLLAGSFSLASVLGEARRLHLPLGD